jgi:hypothetical protein
MEELSLILPEIVSIADQFEAVLPRISPTQKITEIFGSLSQQDRIDIHPLIHRHRLNAAYHRRKQDPKRTGIPPKPTHEPTEPPFASGSFLSFQCVMLIRG